MMEYPFKDLLPLDQVLEREGYYNDWTHLDPEVFYSLTQISEYIKTKGYGVDVRLLISQLAEHFGLKTTQVVDLANALSTKHDALKDQFDVIIRDATSGADWGGEIVLARGGKATLGQRLDETAAQLAQKASKNDLDLSLSNISNSTPIFVDTVSDMADVSRIYVNISDGMIYYHDGNDFKSTGKAYQSTGIDYDSVTPADVSFIDATETFKSDQIGYVAGRVWGGSAYVPRFDIGDGNSRVLVIPVKPNARYHIKKSPSDRFRIAGHTQAVDPEIDYVGLSHWYKHESATESTETTFTLTTRAEDSYIYIYVSTKNEEPKLVVYGDDLVMNSTIEMENITKSKNLFDGTYTNGQLFNGSYFGGEAEGVLAILPAKPSTAYSISKSPSERFTVIKTDRQPAPTNNGFPYTEDQLVIEDRSANEVSFTTDSDTRAIFIYVANTGEPPAFMQVEESSEVTSWETYGYKFYPEAKPYFNEVESNFRSDVISVEQFREGSTSDSDMIQKAFDYADGKVVSFDSGREYLLDETVIAQADKVRGIEGNNALLRVSGDILALRYQGNMAGSASPRDTKGLDINEANAFIHRLRVASVTQYTGRGIELEGLLSSNIESCHIFGMNTALILKGFNRNLNLVNSHFRDNSEVGFLMDTINLHQLNMSGMHIDYNRVGIKVHNSGLANWQMSACDLEAGWSDWAGRTTSLIEVSGATTLWEVNFSALTLQDHTSNSAPLLNFDLTNGALEWMSIGDSNISNSVATQPLIYLNGADTVTLNSLTLKNGIVIDTSIMLGDNNKRVIISNSHLPAPIVYNPNSIEKLMIVNNTTDGFVLNDVNDGNVLIANNI